MLKKPPFTVLVSVSALSVLLHSFAIAAESDQQSARLRGEFNPLEFGAAGDGVTDDLKAMKACNVAATVARGVIVITHAHRISDAFKPTTSMQGRGGKILVDAKDHNDAVLFFRQNGKYCRDLHVDGLGRCRGIVVAQSDRFTVARCRTTNTAAQGIRVDLSDDASILGNHVSGITYEASGISADGIYVGGCRRARIADNLAENFERIGIVTESNGQESEQPLIFGNTVRDAKHCDDSDGQFNAGIWVENTFGGTIRDNVIYGIAKTNPRSARQTSGRVRHIVIGFNNKRAPIPDSVLIEGNSITCPADANTQYLAISISGTSQPTAAKVVTCRSNRIQGSAGLSTSGRIAQLVIDDLSIIGGRKVSNNSGYLSLDGGTYTKVSISRFKPIDCVYFDTKYKRGAAELSNVSDIAILAGAKIGELSIDDCHDVRLYQHTDVFTQETIKRMRVTRSRILLKDYPIQNSGYPCIYADFASVHNCEIIGGAIQDGGPNTSSFIVGNGSLVVAESVLTNVTCSTWNGTGNNPDNDFSWKFENCDFRNTTIKMKGTKGHCRIGIDGNAFRDWPATGAFSFELTGSPPKAMLFVRCTGNTFDSKPTVEPIRYLGNRQLPTFKAAFQGNWMRAGARKVHNFPSPSSSAK